MPIYETGNQTLSNFGIKKQKLYWKSYSLNEGGVSMKIPVEEVVKLDDGKHEGKIEDIKYRDDPYNYVDVIVKIGNGKLTASYPKTINEDSMLGELLTRFGAKLEVGKEEEPEEYLTKGLDVELQIINKKSKKDDKEYANIIRESLKPKK